MPAKDPILETRNLTYTHAGEEEASLKDLNVTINRGEFVVIIGASGSGKSTLLRCLSGITPHLTTGDMSGSVLVDGNDTQRVPLYELAQTLGIVTQDPADQVFSLMAEDEVAFGPENIGLAREEIAARVELALSAVGLSDRRKALTLTMSGGEKQRLAIASCLALRPQVLLFDEPTTDLDPETKESVVATINELRQRHGMTIVVAEHAIGEIVQHADRMIVMSDGRAVLDGTPAVVLGENSKLLRSLGLRMPGHIKVAHMLQDAGCDLGLFPVTVEALAARIDSLVAGGGLPPQPPDRRPPVDGGSGASGGGGEFLQMTNCWFRHAEGSWQARDLTISIGKGEYVAVVGRNGAGKSTFGKLLVGLLQPEKGKITVAGLDTSEASVARICRDLGFLFQNPAHQLFTHQVKRELLFGLNIAGVTATDAEERAEETLEFVGLEHKASEHPLKLSQGERKRLAAGTVLALHPHGMVLDEPTTGQDERRLAHLLKLTSQLHQSDATIIMITHDMDVVADHATRVIGLADGRLEFDGSAAHLFEDAALMHRLGVRAPETVQVAQLVESVSLGSPVNADELVFRLLNMALDQTPIESYGEVKHVPQQSP